MLFDICMVKRFLILLVQYSTVLYLDTTQLFERKKLLDLIHKQFNFVQLVCCYCNSFLFRVQVKDSNFIYKCSNDPYTVYCTADI